MYGPPQDCKRKTEKEKLVCANVFGLWWSPFLRTLHLAYFGFLRRTIPLAILAPGVLAATLASAAWRFHSQFANAEDTIDDCATGREALSGFKRRGSAGMKLGA